MTERRDAAALAVFRMAFGTLVAVSAVRFLAYGWVDTLFDTRFRFHYFGFGWVPSLGVEGVRALFVALVVLGILVAFGALYRVAIVLLFIAFTWVQLIDVSNYLNHYYLVSLLALLLCFMPLNALWSVDAWLRPALRQETLPAWCTRLLRFQVGVVYVFAAIAKFNSDWLMHGAPLHLWLSARGEWLTHAELAWFASWGGFLFDLTAPFLLSFKRTRKLAYVFVIIFHTTTSLLFPIGMFPFIMMVSTLIFFEPSWPRRWLKRAEPAPVIDRTPRWVLVPVVLWCVVQVALPLRTFFYGGDVSWHEQGMRFSWRVMTREKNGSVTYVVRQRSTGREWHVTPRQYLTGVQERELSVQPDLILQLGRRIGDDFRAKGIGDVEVRADTLVSLNGRAAIPLVDASVDLLTLADGLAASGWIMRAPSGAPLAPAMFSQR